MGFKPELVMGRTKSRGKDKVKEASRRLKVILKTSRKFGVSAEDLGGLRGTGRLVGVSTATGPYGTLGSALLIALLIVAAVSASLQHSPCPSGNATKEIQIQTIRIERLPLDGGLEAPEDSTLYNDSEDGEEGHLRMSHHLRLRRGR